MKGMNTKLILNEPDDKHNILKTHLQESCAKHGVPAATKDQVIQDGLELFELGGSDNYVFPLGSYQTINEYILAHRGEHDAVQAEEKKLTKKELYSRLLKAATAGEMVEYRRLRPQYTAAL